MFCREQIAQLRDATPAIRHRGAEPHVVGNGTPQQAADLAAEMSLDVPLLTDPDRRSFAVLGARRSLGGVLHPDVALGVVRALRRGHRQAGVQGDPMQLGGVIAVRPPGEVVYRYLSHRAGDHPDLSAVIATLDPDGHHRHRRLD
jgi:hypothetical protein